MIFTGRTAIYTGPDEQFDDGHGHTVARGVPMPVSDAAAARLGKLPNMVVTPPTWHVKAGGCC
jgi:hypothetical protein